MGRRLTIILWLLLPVSLAGQVREIDQKTYQLYQQKEWEKLIQEGKKAQAQGVDFFYLRTRMAIAWYHQGNYYRAIPYFEKALKEIPGDEVLLEYLYYAYIFTGRRADALLLAKSFPLSLEKRLKVKPKGVTSFYIDGGYTFNTDKETLLNTPLGNSEDLFGQDLVFKDQSYFQAGITSELGHRIQLSQAYSFLGQNRTLRINNNGKLMNFSFPLTQNQYYLGLKIAFAKGIQLHFSGHGLWLKSHQIDTTHQGQGQSFGIRYDKNEKKWFDYVTNAGIHFKFPFINLSLSGNFGELNDEKIFQGNGHLILYPLGNNDLYFVSNATYQKRTPNQKEKNKNEFIFHQKIGGRLSKVWLEGYLTIGELTNFVEHDNLTIWNGFFPIKTRYGGAIFVPLIPNKLTGTIRYSYRREEGTRLLMTPNEEFYTQTYTFTNHTLLGGLSWNF